MNMKELVMADCEGRGKVAPKPIRFILSGQEAQIIRRLVVERTSYRGYANSQSKWKQGLVGASQAVLIGMTGQYALRRYLGIADDDDSRLKPRGDGGIDLEHKGLTMQVKTRRRAKTESLIRRVTDRKKVCPLVSEIMAFCQYENETTVLLLGWIRCRHARLNGHFKRSSVADHWNLVIGDSDLLPIRQLKEEMALL
jgi:hypothetical protein